MEPVPIKPQKDENVPDANDPLSQLASQVEASPSATKRPVSMYHAEVEPEAPGNFPLGIVGACVGAGIGAGVWMLVGYFLNIEIGILAILVGLLVGYLALKFAKRPSHALGLCAGVIAVVGILVGAWGMTAAGLQSEEFNKELKKTYQMLKQEGEIEITYADFSQSVRDEVLTPVNFVQLYYFDFSDGDCTRDSLLSLLFAGLAIFEAWKLAATGSLKKIT